ncbi:MAG: flagellar M-ring protein FliF C-terminal domain-containing protein, partial [Pseudorhodoplanes sp.]
LVDGTYTRNDKGEMTYAPRAKEEIDRIAALVRSAIGFDQKRGDQVEVVNLRLAEAPQNIIAEPKNWIDYLQFTKDDIMRGIELGVMLLLGLIVILIVVRPVIRRIIGPEKAAAAAAALAAATGGAGGILVGPNGTMTIGGAPGTVTGMGGGPNVIVGGEQTTANISTHTSQMIDIAQVQGQVHAQSVQKVGELADKNPQETVAIIRSWLHEAA